MVCELMSKCGRPHFDDHKNICFVYYDGDELIAVGCYRLIMDKQREMECLYANLHAAAGDEDEDAQLEAARGDLEALRQLARAWGIRY